LKRYAPKLKWQRYSDQRHTHQPVYETEMYRYYTTQSSNEEEEMIFKYFVDIKDSLTLAYQGESQANYHHYNAGMKLCLLQERLSGEIRTIFNRYRNGKKVGLLFMWILWREPQRAVHCQ
jgi:hypothetical protein